MNNEELRNPLDDARPAPGYDIPPYCAELFSTASGWAGVMNANGVNCLSFDSRPGVVVADIETCTALARKWNQAEQTPNQRQVRSMPAIPTGYPAGLSFQLDRDFFIDMFDEDKNHLHTVPAKMETQDGEFISLQCAEMGSVKTSSAHYVVVRDFSSGKTFSWRLDAPIQIGPNVAPKLREGDRIIAALGIDVSQNKWLESSGFTQAMRGRAG